MYPITMSISYLIIAFCYFGAAEPPPARGYGPPTPIHLDSNEVSSHEQYNSPLDFGNYASFSSGSPSGYSHPSAGYTKSSPSFGGHYGSGSPSPYKGGKGGGVSSSYISIVHGPGGGSPGKGRPHGAYTAAAASKTPAAVGNGFHGANFGAPSFGSSNSYTNEVPSFAGGAPSAAFGKIFGGGGSYSGGGGGGGFDYAGAAADYNKGYEGGGASDEVASYSSGGPSYATFTGSKPSFSAPTFSQGTRGNAYSTSNINFGGGAKASGHGNFHPPSFAANFKPSASTKTYNRYNGPSSAAGYVGGGTSSGGSFGASPLVGSESGYNSRALKTGYTVDGAEDFNSGEDANLFSAFGDGAGFKVQSSYSTG